MRWSLVAAAVVAWPAVAPAQSDYSIHAVGTTDQGWTSNVNNDPVDDDPATPDPESSFFGNVSPGALFTFRSPNSSHEIRYALSYTYFLVDEGGDALTHTLGWGGEFQPTPRTGLNLNASLAIGQTTPIVREAQLATPGFQPPARTDFRQVQVGETFEYQLSQFWRVRQGLGFADVVSEPANANVETSARRYTALLGSDRAFRRSTLGLQVRGTFLSLLADDPMLPEPRLDQDQLNVAVEAVYVRELAARWRGDVTAGAVRTSSPDGEFDSATNPSGQVGVSYAPDWGAMRLSYRRAVGVDLFLAQNTSNDGVAFNAWAPLWRFDQSTLVGGTNLSYGRFEGIDLELGEPQSSFEAYVGGASMTWTPDEAPYGLAVNYTYFRQDSDQNLPLPLQEFTRHTVSISAFGRMPSRRAGELTDLDRQRAAREGREDSLESERRNQRPGF